MKSPMDSITVYRVSGALKNPYTGDDWSEAIIPISWSKTGVARAWWGYSDRVLATAGGYGYDKGSTVLARAVALLSGHDDIREAEGVGMERVVYLAARHTILVKKIV